MNRHLSPEAMTAYRATAERRWKEKERERLARHKRAWRIARQASMVLRKQYGADKVMAFGSLVHDDWFSETSDVDLAVWGLQSEDYFVAVAKLQDLSPEFQIDLVAVEHCKPELRTVIMNEGELL